MLLGISLALPFLGARVLYAVLSGYAPATLPGTPPATGDLSRFNNQTGSWGIYLFMSVLAEYMSVSIYMVFGIITPLSRDYAGDSGYNGGEPLSNFSLKPFRRWFPMTWLYRMLFLSLHSFFFYMRHFVSDGTHAHYYVSRRCHACCLVTSVISLNDYVLTVNITDCIHESDGIRRSCPTRFIQDKVRQADLKMPILSIASSFLHDNLFNAFHFRKQRHHLQVI